MRGSGVFVAQKKVKMRDEAVAKAAKEWAGERERMAKEARVLRQKLEASVSQNKQLVTDKNILQVWSSCRSGYFFFVLSVCVCVLTMTFSAVLCLVLT